MFWRTLSFRQALNALMAEKTLSLVELTPQNPFALTLKNALIDALKNGYASQKDDAYLIHLFNSEDRFVQLNMLAFTFNNLRKPPISVGDHWEPVRNPWGTRNIKKQLLEAEKYILRHYGQSVQLRPSKFVIQDWGLEDLSYRR